MLVTVGSLAVFTMVAMAFFHMRFSTVVVNQRSARNMAESALATALTEVWKNSEYGTERAPHHTVHLKSSTGDDAEGFLTFNQGKAADLGVPFSTNNFMSDASVEGGTGQVVPESTVHLVALGECRGSRYKAEVLYYVPPYPNALASSGPIVSSGGLLVAGIPTVEKATEINGADGLDRDQLEPGHVVSNSSNGSAIQIGPESEIRGDVVAVGGIKIGNPVEILGEVRPNAGAQNVPELGIDDIFTKLAAVDSRDVHHDTQMDDETTIDYFTEATVPLTVKGDLILDGGVLYCQDDLTVWGQVRGNGAIFSRGDVKIDSGADLSASDQIALVAKGSLELHGTDQNDQFFNGLVYSEEEILADNITIIGAAVVNGDEDSLLQLDNVSLIKSPVSTTLVIGLPEQSGFSIPDLSTDNDDRDGFERFLGIGTEKTEYLEPPNIVQTLQSTLAGALQVSAVKMPDVDGEARFSVLFEGVVGRGNGTLTGVSDLTAEEIDNLQLETYPHRFEKGKLYIRYERANNVTKDEAVNAVSTYRALLQDMLAEPIEYTKVTEKKKHRFLGKTKKTTTRSKKVFDPAAGTNIDVGAYLDRLENPKKDPGPTIVDLNLNQVFDPAETSRILFWKTI